MNPSTKEALLSNNSDNKSKNKPEIAHVNVNSQYAAESGNKESEKSSLDKNARAVISESFWKLSEYNMETRMTAIKQICEYFKKFIENKSTEETNYILSRVVRGLFSNRKYSRIGYSCALTELLNRFDQLKFDKVLEIIDKNTQQQSNAAESNGLESKQRSANALTKEETRQMQIGIIFAYLCWIKSSRLNKNTEPQLIESMSKKLNEMRKSHELKNYVQQLATQVLVALIKKSTNHSMFSTLILPTIESDLVRCMKALKKSSAKDVDKEDLNLLMICMSQHSKEMESFISKQKLSFDQRVIISMDNHEILYDFISKSTESLPSLQQFCTELIEHMLKQNLSEFKKFWLNMIDNKLCLRKESNKKYLSYKLFAYCISLVNEQNYSTLFQEVLLQSHHIISSLMNNYIFRANNLNELSKAIVKEIADLARQKENLSSLRVDLTMELVKAFKNYYAIADLVNSFMSSFNENELKIFFDFLINELSHNDHAHSNQHNYKKLTNNHKGHGRSESDQEENKIENSENTPNKHIWIINTIGNLSKNSNIFKASNLIKEIVNFLAMNFFFEVNANDNLKSNNLKLINNGNKKLADLFNETLMKHLGVILSKCDDDCNGILVELLENLAKLMNTARQNSNECHIRPQKKIMNKIEQYDKFMSKALTIVRSMYTCHKGLTNQESLQKNEKKNNLDKDVIQIYFTVALFEFLRSTESVVNATNLFEDLALCYNQYTSSKKSKVEFL
jgi:hypothetical protein